MIKIIILLLISVTSVTRANEPLIISTDLSDNSSNLAAGGLCSVVNESNFNTPCFTLPFRKTPEKKAPLITGQAQLTVVSAEHYYYHKKKNNKLMPLMGLYTETLLVVVKKDSRIDTLFDLKESTVNLGKEDSRLWLTSKKILQAIGISLTDFPSVTLLAPDSEEAKEAFCYGNIDALILLETTPSKTVHEIIASCPSRIISLTKAVTDKITKAHPYFHEQIVATNTYHNIPKFSTLGIDAFLVSHRDSFTNYQGYQMVKLLVSKLKTLQKYAPPFALSDKRVLTSPTAFSKLQPGANRYFKELNLDN